MKIIYNKTILTSEQLQAMKFVRTPEVQKEYESIPVEHRTELFKKDVEENGFRYNEYVTVISNKYPYVNNTHHYIIIVDCADYMLADMADTIQQVIDNLRIQLVFENEHIDKSIQSIRHYHAF